MEGAFDLLICDCDGVIIDSEVIAECVLDAALRSAFPHHEVTAVLATCLGRPTRALVEELTIHIGEPISSSFVEWLDHEVYEALRRDAGPIVGAREALEQIALPVAIVSNSSYEWIEAALARAGLTSRVGSAIFSADGLARPKPAPDIYLTAAKKLRVAPARCLVVEDSVSGVTAARAAGMSVLGFVGGSHILFGHATRLLKLGVLEVVERMQELPAAVAAARANFSSLERDPLL